MLVIVSDFLRSSPMLASPRGGTRLLLSGPCLQPGMILRAKIDEVEVSATFINKYMAEVFTPSLYYEGEALVELSTDNGLTYSTNTTITIGTFMFPSIHKVSSERTAACSIIIEEMGNINQ